MAASDHGTDTQLIHGRTEGSDRPPPLIRRLVDAEAGQFQLASIIALVVVVLVTGAAAALLAQTMNEARQINEKAQVISGAAGTINTSTDAVDDLTTTDKTAKSILTTAEPLEGRVGRIVRLAREINGLAGSINSTAGEINSTAGGINSEAAQILDVAGRINSNVAQINKNLDGTLAIADRIDGDTSNIIREARTACQNANGIDDTLGGGTLGGIVVPAGQGGECPG